MKPLEYLSEPWFECVREAIAGSGGQETAPVLEIGFIIQREDGTLLNHYQVWADDTLLSWNPGMAPDPALIVRRGFGPDRDDVLARAHGWQIDRSSQFMIPSSSGLGTIVSVVGLAVGYSFGPVRQLDGVRLRARIEVHDSPIGPIDRLIEISDNLCQVGDGRRDVAVDDIRISVSYVDVIDWLMGPYTFGNLMTREIEVTGSMWGLSVLEWCVAGYARRGRGEGPPDASRAFQLLHRTRTSPACQRLIDTIEASTL